MEKLTRAEFKPTYSPWRHGGWYVGNVTYPSGACGCVSRNYADRKWRIACDPRPFESQPTFKCRDDAAYAEYLLTLGITADYRELEALNARIDAARVAFSKAQEELAAAIAAKAAYLNRGVYAEDAAAAETLALAVQS